MALVLGGCAGKPSSAKPVTSTTAEVKAVVRVLSSANTKQLEGGLVSDDRASVESVLPLALRDAYAAKPWQMLPKGSSLVIDRSKLVVAGDLASVPATVTGPEPGRWLLLLIRDGDHWAAYGTHKATT